MRKRNSVLQRGVNPAPAARRLWPRASVALRGGRRSSYRVASRAMHSFDSFTGNRCRGKAGRDGPARMANRVTRVFRRHEELFDEEAWKRINAGEEPFQFPELRMVSSQDESIAINDEKRSCIIMSTSGMCNAGRIKHHLVHNIKRPESLILFVGYQASGTLGRLILEGRKEVRILGRMWPVQAKVGRVEGFSGHTDRQMLISWLKNFESAPRQVFLTHGDERAAEALAEELRTRFGWPVEVPSYQDTVQLDG